MAKIVGYQIRENYTFEVDGKKSTLDDVTIHVEQRAVNTPGTVGAGRFVATYRVELKEFPSVVNQELKKTEIRGFLEECLGKECFLEKTLVGKSERLAGITFIGE